MGYIQETAAPGEQIIGEASFSWLYLALMMMPFWIGLILVFIGFEVLTHSGLLDKYVPQVILDYGFIAILIVGVIRYMMMAAPWMSLEIAATTHRVVYAHGVLTRRSEEVAINRLEGINLHQSFTGRMFNFGTLVISGIGQDEIRLPPISNPLEFRRMVQEAVNLSQSPDASFLGSH